MASTGSFLRFIDLPLNEWTRRPPQLDLLAGLTNGNLEQVIWLEGITQTYAYQDPNDAHNVTSFQRHAGATPVLNTYDNQDRVIQQAYGDQTIAFDYLIDRTETVLTETVVDDQGTLLHTAVTRYEFDASGYLTRMTDPLGHQVVHIRDANQDEIRTEIWEKQPDTSLILLQAVDYTYDGMGRKLTEAVTLDSGETITRSRTYDT
jgi:YD repeat-containing protein